ncbi:MAG: hypothetical protein ACO1N0_03915 [Fluviicola sp.]
MKQVLLFLSILLFASCKEESNQLSEDFWAIAHDSKGHKITLNDSTYFEVPKLQYIVFLYHDSVFKVEIDRETSKEHYSLLTANDKVIDTLMASFDSYRKTNLKDQLQKFEENRLGYGCFSDGYFLFNTSHKIQFGLFDFMNYYSWRKYGRLKEMSLKPKQFPKIYQTVYHTFHSKWMDHYMSDEYHYKEQRTHY